jgi:hypothetical protein
LEIIIPDCRPTKKSPEDSHQFEGPSDQQLHQLLDDLLKGCGFHYLSLKDLYHQATFEMFKSYPNINNTILQERIKDLILQSPRYTKEIFIRAKAL